MNFKTLLTIIVASLVGGSNGSANIVGTDFSNAAVFGATGGVIDLTSVDDLDLTDNISVSNLFFPTPGDQGGGFLGLDPGAQGGSLGSDLIATFDGTGGNSIPLPAVGSAVPAGLSTFSFDVTVGAGTTLDLTDVSFDFRQATGNGAEQRYLAFNTSLDGGLITFSQIGVVRNGFDSESVSLSGAAFQGLTNQTVTFNFFAGGTGTGNIDIDNIIVNGISSPISSVPEPTTAIPMIVLALGMCSRRRKN